MSSAATEIAGQTLLHLVHAGEGVLGEQGLRCHDHAVRAVAALRGLFGDERSLHRIGFFGRAEAFEGGDALAFDRVDRRGAGAHGLAVEDDSAGSALGEAAAELRSVEPKGVSQDVEQWLRGVPGIYRCRVAVQLKSIRRHTTPVEYFRIKLGGEGGMVLK